MAYKPLDRELRFYRARVVNFDGEKCVDEVEVEVQELVAIQFDVKNQTFMCARGDESILKRELRLQRVAHLRDKETCPFQPSELWWSSRAKAISALRAITLKSAQDNIKSAKGDIKHKEEALEDAIKTLAADEAELQRLIALFKEAK